LENFLVLVNAHSAADLGEVFDLEVTLVSSSGLRWVGNLERKISNKLSTDGTAVEGNSDGVGDDDTKSVIGVLALRNQSGGSQVGIGILDVSVQGNTEDLPIGRAAGCESDGLHKVTSRGDRAAFLALHASNLTGEAGVGHGDLNVLDHAGLDALDSLAAAVADVQVGAHLIAVVVDVLLKGDLEVKFARAESEALGNKSRWLASTALSWCILYPSDGEGDAVALVKLLISTGSDENAELVQDTKGLGGFVALQNNRVRGHLGQGHDKGVGVASQFLHQTVLDLVDGGIVGSREDLLRCQLHLLGEAEAHDLIFFSAKAVHHVDRSEYFSSLEVAIVDEYDTINGLSALGVVNEVTAAEVASYFAIRSGLLENFDGVDHVKKSLEA